MKAERGEENEKVDLRQRTKDFALRVISMFGVGTRFAASLGRDALPPSLKLWVDRSAFSEATADMSPRVHKDKAKLGRCTRSVSALSLSPKDLQTETVRLTGRGEARPLSVATEKLIAIFVAIIKHTKQK